MLVVDRDGPIMFARIGALNAAASHLQGHARSTRSVMMRIATLFASMVAGEGIKTRA
jgi:hypothetical protein